MNRKEVREQFYGFKFKHVVFISMKYFIGYFIYDNIKDHCFRLIVDL